MKTHSAVFKLCAYRWVYNETYE